MRDHYVQFPDKSRRHGINTLQRAGARDRERRTRMKVLARIIAAFSFSFKRPPSLIFRRSRSLAFTYASTYSLVAHEQAAGASETL